MPRRDVIVVGASAGGVEALRTLAAGLPADLPAIVLVVLHTPPTSRSALAAILDRSGPLRAVQASEGDSLESGRILVAPPDRHLIVYDGHVTLSRGPRENGHRPAVDVLFRSAARALGPRVVAVVLSGTLDDGTAGMVAVHERGGLGVVQDPRDATYSGMPLAALSGDKPDHVVPVGEMAALLSELVKEEVVRAGPTATELMNAEVEMAAYADDHRAPDDRPGVPSGFACPDCHGILFEIHEGPLRRFRCRVGHAWSADSLAAQQSVAVDGALWMALRALEEKAALADRMARVATDRGHSISAASFIAQADDARTSARTIRELLERTSTLTPDIGVELVGEHEP